MRRTGREIALKILFQNEFASPLHPRDWPQTLADEDFIPLDKMNKDSLRFAEQLVYGVNLKKSEIDQMIQRFARHWKLDRMSTIDRNILRIGVYEMMFAPNPTPITVAINEALEISKIYGTQDSPSFINGILDQIQKEAKVATVQEPAPVF